jgi:UDP-N-acetylmuramoyl-L-alanyl-D-glutamate--2,6-diaminopimelate ligase
VSVRLSELLAGLTDVPAARDIVVPGLCLDHRRLRRGEVFVALPGRRSHGLAFAAAALEAGAALVLADPAGFRGEAPEGTLVVAGLAHQLGQIADRLHAAPSAALTVIGVTGTNGKTSVVQLLAQALDALGQRVATIGTLGAGMHGAVASGEHTTPDVLSVHALLAGFRDAGASHVAMEVSSHALDQGRVDGVRFRSAVFTNLSRDHLDYHGSMDAYAAAKARLFAWPGLRHAFINLDDAEGRRLAERMGGEAERYGFGFAADAVLRASGLSLSLEGLAFDLDSPWGAGRVHSRLLGAFNAHNLLAVIGCLGALGFALADILAVVPRLAPVRGRMNRLGGDGAPLVVVDYAHTPDALEKALASLRAHGGGRLICVFGCGGERDRGKRPEMGRIAERLADQIYITDDNPRGEDGDAIVAGILDGLAHPARAVVERDRARAIAAAVAGAGPADIVLVAGKGHETWQETGGVRRPFDDLEHARRALEARSC